MSFDIETKFFTVKEVSDLLKLSELTIYKYIKDAKLAAFEFGGHFRISSTALQAFINDHKSMKGEIEA